MPINRTKRQQKVKDIREIKALYNSDNDDKLIYVFQAEGGIMPMHVDEFLDDECGYLEEYGTTCSKNTNNEYDDIVKNIIDIEIGDMIDDAPTIGQSQENKLFRKIMSSVKFVVIKITDGDIIGFVADGYEDVMYRITEEMLEKFARANEDIRNTKNITDYWFR